MISVILALVLPALFVSAELFHLQLIPISFLLTIVNSIKGIPLSPSYEMFFTFLIFEILNEANLDAFLCAEGLKLAVFADDPNNRKETMDIVVIAPELKKAFGDTLTQSVFADFQVARALAARWGLRSMPAVAIFHGTVLFRGCREGVPHLITLEGPCQVPPVINGYHMEVIFIETAAGNKLGIGHKRELTAACTVLVNICG
jgi:hypothetical protein